MGPLFRCKTLAMKSSLAANLTAQYRRWTLLLQIYSLICMEKESTFYIENEDLSKKHMFISVGTLLGNTRLEKTRRFLEGRVLARNYSKRKIANSTRSYSSSNRRVMP